ncbi:MAG TPA: protein-L-isoaspartate(D-aspartate) O-methyltransferase [Steroidobacteraceae bacterium]|nr:protein-L-isoaspartate(D-aspartate) O-methyltransferase [Steroidobacteraceae bacterium]
MKDLSTARQRMVETQIARRGVRNPRVLEAMATVPREAFVAPEVAEFAYEDAPLPIGAGQTISQPYVVALMIDAAEIEPGERVLEVGTGSGYAAAVMSRIAAEVYTIERHESLACAAAQRLAALTYDNVHVRTGDGTQGWPENAPFDAILVAAAAPQVPGTLKAQLAIGGRLIIPVGTAPGMQTLRKITRVGEGAYEDDTLGGVAFVPLIGEHGWKEDGSSSTRL